MFQVNSWRGFCAFGALITILLYTFVIDGPTVFSTVLYCAFLILMPAHNVKGSKIFTVFCLFAALLIAAANTALITLRESGM